MLSIVKSKSSNNELQARDRVSQDPDLKAHEDFIFADWPNWDEHCQWVHVAPKQEILDWVEAGK